MVSPFFYILLIVSCILGVLVLRKAEKNLPFTQINIFNWVYFVEFIAMGAISPFLILKVKANNWALKDIPDTDFPLKEVLIALSWCAVMIPAGIIIAKRILGRLNYNTNFQDFIESPVQAFKSRGFYIFWLCILVAYAISLVNSIGFVPQIYALDLNPEAVAKLRGEISHNLPTSMTIFRLIGLTIAPIISLASLAKLIEKPKFQNLLLFLAFLLLSLFFNTLNLNKSALAYVFVGLAATLVLLGKKIDWRGLSIIAVTTTILLLIGFQSTSSKDSPLKTLEGIFGRIAISQSYGNYISFYLFPKFEDHIGFRSLTRQVKYLGVEPKERAARTMMRRVAPKEVKNGTAGSMVSTFFAEAWANWGIIGVLLSPLMVGFILKIMVTFLTNLGKTSITIGFLAYLTYTFGAHKSISKILLPRYFIAAFILIQLISFLFYKLNQKKCKEDSPA